MEAQDTSPPPTRTECCSSFVERKRHSLCGTRALTELSPVAVSVAIALENALIALSSPRFADATARCSDSSKGFRARDVYDCWTSVRKPVQR